MASDLAFVEFVLDQLDEDLAASYKRMFGEFGLYAGGKFFGVICDDRLFVKPTEAGRTFVGDVVEAPAYPGARPSLLIEDRIDDPAWLSDLVRVTVQELPEPGSRRRGKKG
jgi:TfoX/Sxy family transcriptional regulator of competence genes